MKVRRIHLEEFKRFENLTIEGLPNTAKLVVLIGPNGCGKTSIFEAFKQWHSRNSGLRRNNDNIYLSKNDSDFNKDWIRKLIIDFHEDYNKDQQNYRKLFHIRSAYRNEAGFTISQLNKIEPALDSPRITALIQNDQSVSDNYQRLVSKSVASLFSGVNDDQTVGELREELIGQVRSSMGRVFEDLVLKGLGDPMVNGAFYFDKGSSSDFHYQNLSGGEKAAFDILLDLIIKGLEFDNTIFCIDEPDLHMHTKLQGSLLHEIFNLINEESQLWIATHSIGMMKKAFELHQANPEDVVFLDFHGHNFDEAVTLAPIQVSKNFWRNSLRTALDDLSDLVVPSRIILCEGAPAGGAQRNPEFDARCYNNIFSSEFPDTTFISVGGEDAVRNQVDLITTLQSLAKGVEFIKLVDKDDKTAEEIVELNTQGIKVLSRRHIESYLLDDEIIELLCDSVGHLELLQECIDAKNNQLQDSVDNRGNPPDDIKSISGALYTDLRRILNLVAAGGNVRSFLRDTMAPLIKPGTNAYSDLTESIFN